MIDKKAEVGKHLDGALAQITNPVPNYQGKVRDIFEKGNELFIVATDRVSAFDVVLGTIPLKGTLLTEQSTFWLGRATEVIDTHLIERVDPQIMLCKKADPLPFEVIIRGYLAGSLMREPAETRGQAYGLSLPHDLKPYQKLETPIVTPTTKAEQGEHDAPISQAEIVSSGLISQKHLDASIEAAMGLFRTGSAFAEKNGLILVDTKYEFGLIDGKVILIDEIHTADSSRFWVSDDYPAAVRDNRSPLMLDKERLRSWLIEQGYQGEGQPPELTDAVRLDLAEHYWELTEKVLGQPFSPPSNPPETRVPAFLTDQLKS
jgi:phosphoribosylaminoimidazole-succinocarboxamide synthase